jgi:hypothetical protein
MEGLLDALEEIIEDIDKAIHKGVITLISSSRQDIEGVGLFEKYFYHHLNSNGCFFYYRTQAIAYPGFESYFGWMIFFDEPCSDLSGFVELWNKCSKNFLDDKIQEWMRYFLENHRSV